MLGMRGILVRERKQTVAAVTSRERRARRARLVTIVNELPEADANTAEGQRHLSLEVRGRRFGWLLDNHHDDKRLALNCRAPAGASRMLTAAEPEKFYVPKYLGHRGWVGIWLDLADVDWPAVEALLSDAYRLTAPRALLRRVWEAE